MTNTSFNQGSVKPGTGYGAAAGNRIILSQESRNRDAKLNALDQNFAKSSTHGTENLFSESIVEQAQLKKPAFNTGTFRLPNEATREGFVIFNPGPGSYSSRINSLGSQFIDTVGENAFKGLLSQQGVREKKLYYTRENGGLKQHN